MKKPTNTNIWRKDYEAFYKLHADENKPVYAYDWCKKFITERLPKPTEGYRPSMVDIGCGDGIWSIVLSDNYKVTGIDNSEQGITNANILADKYNAKVHFQLADILETQQKFEYAFCRGPEFFGGYAPNSEVFQLFKRAVAKLFTKRMYFIVYSKPPFSRYANDEKTSYYHDPEVLVEEFSAYGTCSYTYLQNYIVLQINK